MQRLRWLIGAVLLGWLSLGPLPVARAQSPQPAAGTCLGGDCQVGSPVIPQQDLSQIHTPPRGFARGAAWFGVVSSALTLAGTITIASLQDREHEPITRGAWLGYTTLAVPIVALGSFTTRRRARVDGLKPLRALGWTAYVGAVSNGAAQWALVLMGEKPSPGFTVGLGVMGAMAFLPHAFDAYVSSRAARRKGFAVLPTPSGFAVRF